MTTVPVFYSGSMKSTNALVAATFISQLISHMLPTDVTVHHLAFRIPAADLLLRYRDIYTT